MVYGILSLLALFRMEKKENKHGNWIYFGYGFGTCGLIISLSILIKSLI